jgi:hypothetical protein
VIVDRYLIFSSWLVAQQPLLDLTESIATFLAEETEWRAPYGQDKHVQVQEKYYLQNTRSPDGTPPWGQPLDYRSGNKRARQQIAEREAGTIEAGFPAIWRNPYDGQEYVPDDALSQENRAKVLLGIARFVGRFSPEAGILTYRFPGRYDRRRQIISYARKTGYGAPLYYAGRGSSLAPDSRELFGAVYFVKEVEGVRLHLEEAHFGFW